MKIGRLQIFALYFKKMVLLLPAIMIASFSYAQNPAVQNKLSATTARQPAKPNDTIAYKSEITNLTDSSIFNLNVTRTGDSNTIFVPGSFESTPIAIPAKFAELKEDQLVTLALVGVDPDGDALDFTILQSPQQGIVGGIASISNTQASVTYQPNANFSGTDQFTFSVEDEQGNRDTSTVLLTMASVNDAPSFTPGNEIAVEEDASAQTLSNWATNLSAGPPDEASQTLSFRILSNNNPALFASVPNLTPNGTLTFTANENANGIANIVLQLQDDGGTTNGGIDTSERFTLQIIVSAVNDAPSFTPGNDVNVNEDAGAQTVLNWATNVNAGPANEASQSLSFTIWSTQNTDLFAELPSVSANGTLTFAAKPDANGTAIIFLQLQDSGGTANGGIDTSARFTLQITFLPVNDAPSFTRGSAIEILEDAGNQVLTNWATDLRTGPENEILQTLEFLVVNNSNPALFSALPTLTPAGTLTFVAQENANGTATVLLQLKDSGGTANGGIDTSTIDTLLININSVNDAPTFVKGADLVIPTDTSEQIFPNWATAINAGPTNEMTQVLTFLVENNDNPALFLESPQIAVDGTLRFKPAPGAVGVAVVSIRLKDDGGSVNGGIDLSDIQIFSITLETN